VEFVREYRLYFYNDQGRIKRVEAIRAANDETAVNNARERHPDDRITVQCASRDVAQLRPRAQQAWPK